MTTYFFSKGHLHIAIQNNKRDYTKRTFDAHVGVRLLLVLAQQLVELHLVEVLLAVDTVG